MRWSDVIRHHECVVSAKTEHKGNLFRVTIARLKQWVVKVEIIDSDGNALFSGEVARHRYIKPALHTWWKERWLLTDPNRCFDWFPARAMCFGLDTVFAKYEVELKRRAKERQQRERQKSFSLAAMLEGKLEPPTLARPTERSRGAPRPQRQPLLSFNGTIQSPEPVPERAPAGAYDRLVRDRSIRWQVYMYVCDQLSGYGERRDRESLDRFLALINCFSGVRFEHVPGDPDAVTVDVCPNYDQPKSRVTIDLKGIV